MANLEEQAIFDEGVYQIATDDVVLGGPDGKSNASAKNLANRTVWLKKQIDNVVVEADINIDNANLSLLVESVAAISVKVAAGIVDISLKKALGQPFWHLGDAPPVGAMQFAAQILNRVEYSELFDSLNKPNRNIKWVTEADKVANEQYGCWSLGDGSTTFCGPDPRGDVIRAWDNSRGVDVDRVLGSLQHDAIRNITAHLTAFAGNSGIVSPLNPSGAFLSVPTGLNNLINGSAGAAASSYGFGFDASRVVPTSSENRMRNTAWMLCFYYE